MFMRDAGLQLGLLQHGKHVCVEQIVYTCNPAENGTDA
jgi:hypothetical protein